MQTEYEYLVFTEISMTNRKTQMYECKNKKSQETLGIVKWNGSWRQYCYFTIIEAVYSSGCLNDIANFMSQINKIHSTERKAMCSDGG